MRLVHLDPAPYSMARRADAVTIAVSCRWTESWAQAQVLVRATLLSWPRSAQPC